jgi:hypothetical protein
MSKADFIAPPLPHSIEAERAILGSILLGGSGIEKALDQVQVTDFYIRTHRLIFRHMKELRSAGLPTNDPVLLYDSLKSANELEEAGGIAYLIRLPDELPKPAHVGHYIEILKVKSRLRGHVVLAQEIHDMALAANGNAAEALRNISSVSARFREEAGQKRDLRIMSGADLANATEENIEWILPGYIAKGAITEIGAKVKAGKTTLVAAIVRAAAEGLEVLGLPTLKSSTVYLTEQPRVSFRQTLQRAGLLGRSDFHLLLKSDVPQMSWPEMVAAVVEECERLGATLLVIDTLPQFAALPGDAENNAGDALAAMEPLQRAAARGLAVVIVRHDRKAGGDVGDSGRGSSAFAGVSDILISLRNPDGKADKQRRVLRAVSRFSETPAELFIELTESGYVALGTSQQSALTAAKGSIMTEMSDSAKTALTLGEIEKLVTISRTTLQRGLNELVDEGTLERVGDGKRSSPFRYFRSQKQSAQPLL